MANQSYLYDAWEKWWAEHWEGWDGAEVSQIACAFADYVLENGRHIDAPPAYGHKRVGFTKLKKGTPEGKKPL